MKFFVLILITAIGIGVWFFAFPRHTITNHPPKNSTIIAFGDSLIEGYGAGVGQDLVSELSRKIGRPIENFGVSGNTSADGLIRIEKALEKNPGTVLLLLGGNDTLRRVPEEITRDNMAQIITLFQERGAVVVLLGVRGGIIGNRRANMYEELSKEYATIYLPDVLNGVLLKPELMYDGIHPNEKGYAVIAERIEKLFSEYNL